jgi:hypothetical protein
MSDIALLTLWQEWLSAFDAEMRSASNYVGDRAHARVRQLEQRICTTPAQGLPGIGVQLGLWMFIAGRDNPDTGDEQAIAAYDAIVRLTGRDFAAEARAIVERADAVLV